MTPFHCSNCNKLLGKIDGNAEIKCPRCKTMNTISEVFDMFTNQQDEVHVQLPQKMIDEYEELLKKLLSGDVTQEQVSKYKFENISDYVESQIGRDHTRARTIQGNVLTGDLVVRYHDFKVSTDAPHLIK